MFVSFFQIPSMFFSVKSDHGKNKIEQFQILVDKNLVSARIILSVLQSGFSVTFSYLFLPTSHMNALSARPVCAACDVINLNVTR